MPRWIPSVLAALATAACVTGAVAPPATAKASAPVIFRIESGALEAKRSHHVVVNRDGTWRAEDGADRRRGTLASKPLARLKRLLKQAAFTSTFDTCDAVATQWIKLTAGKRKVRIEQPCGSSADAVTWIAYRCLEAHTGSPSFAGADLDAICALPPP